MNTHKLYFLLLICTGLVFFTSCDDDEPSIPNEEELITTLNFHLTPIGGGDVITFSFQDLDGDGGNAPVITSGTLTENTMYSGRLELLNELEDPTENITEEVEEEKEDHQFFFTTDIGDLDIIYDDSDADGNPVGITTTVSTGAAGTGTLTITLQHEPEKTATGVADGDMTNAGGEIDIEVIFDITIQ